VQLRFRHWLGQKLPKVSGGALNALWLIRSHETLDDIAPGGAVRAPVRVKIGQEKVLQVVEAPAHGNT
jgi:hypothetical protein